MHTLMLTKDHHYKVHGLRMLNFIPHPMPCIQELLKGKHIAPSYNKWLYFRTTSISEQNGPYKQLFVPSLNTGEIKNTERLRL